MAENVEAVIQAWVTEVIELRHGDAGDDEGPLRAVSIEDGVQSVLHELTRVRKRSDRVDFIRTQISLVRTRLRKNRAVAKFKEESKLMETTSNRNKVRVDFESSAAIKADAGLEAFEERRAAHEAQVLADYVEDSFWIVDRVTAELNSIRNDLRVTVRSLQFESTLEH